MKKKKKKKNGKAQSSYHERRLARRLREDPEFQAGVPALVFAAAIRF